MNKITFLEKAALVTTGAAAAFKTLLWSLQMTVDSTEGSIVYLRIAFAVLSFVAFDLVIVAVAMRGWSASGAVTVVVAALVSALIALDVARVWDAPALHAAPAVTLAVFTLHLMLSNRTSTAEPATQDNAASQITQAVQVNVAPAAAIPETFAALTQYWAAQLPQHSPAMLAAKLGTSPDTVRRALTTAVIAEQES